ncbi:MAG: cofactor-independent phosphoglycerate mutase [Thermodesulfovibrionales bacterium]|nr:cofactor-independent phosphoglycerate mutase [Thermodesulfovibrionales bacterium]
MKYIVMIGDGMADRPVKELGGKTPLEKAFTPNMDKLAREGTIGMVRTIPKGFHPGSDVANLSILGYDPAQYYTGRAPFEAASMGVGLKEKDVAYRCNLVTLGYDKQMARAHMKDYCAGHISTGEAAELIKELNASLGSEEITFYPGVSYRHLMVWAGGSLGPECTPPHDILDKEVTDYLPVGEGEETLRDLMLRSVGVLEAHPVNKKRVESGRRQANSIWLWGQGKKPSLPSFTQRYGIKGVMVSAVDLTKGLGIYAGLEILKVPGVTGYLDTNYVGKAEYSLNALERVDFAYIHVEAPDEAGHSGNCNDKIKAIEDFDALVVGTVLRGIKPFDEYKILLLPDHATPVEARTHTEEPVPFVLYDSRQKKDNKGARFDETLSERDDIVRIEEGFRLMDYFMKEG